jgi:ATP-dependent DNA ligase
LNRRFEGVGVMRNVKRTIRAAAKDVIADLAPPPQWIEPELCKLVTRIPAGDNWAHEVKFDGFRMHTRIVKGRAAQGRRTAKTGKKAAPAA